ncbi:MAG TPA: DUF3035 domain-containing protein [Rhizomicrobium sp.]|nr:DUF3035 domain-containing protein [Rhizomicrobium sp.]
MNIRTLRAAALVVVAAGALAGCDTLRDAAGMSKSAPDEFAVLTKAPLTIPPDYNLLPPRPGAVPTNQTDPTDTAQTALFGSDPATVASQLPDTYSEGERMLLANAGIQGADPAIRQHLASDNKNMVGADDSFTNDILFWQKPKADNGTPLNSDAEARKLDTQKSGQAAPSGQDQGKPAQKDEDEGWFSSLFDWF